MTAPFVKLTASAPGRTLEMVSPVDQAWDALWALAGELPNTFLFSAEPVDDINLKSESVPS